MRNEVGGRLRALCVFLCEGSMTSSFFCVWLWDVFLMVYLGWFWMILDGFGSVLGGFLRVSFCLCIWMILDVFYF